MKSRLKGQVKRRRYADFGGKDRRCKSVNALEGDGKEFEMNSLMNSEPVLFLEVL